MPGDGAITFGDLIGKLDDLRVSCDKCGRAGRYQVQRLIKDRGRDGKIVDWLDELTENGKMRGSTRNGQAYRRPDQGADQENPGSHREGQTPLHWRVDEG